MDQSTMLFVVCVNDESLYSRCKSHIMQLAVPPSYSVDIMPTMIHKAWHPLITKL
ncbi:hypothetical protein J7E23_12265 [Pseudomonas sp. ISL-88]|uniref:glycosyltransferase n=1 Tax=Pseudomonas sp. ISL-88 TaxID=2819169 RepID=UPI001BE8787D|nr:glycosyltransferase [Pseudomonas sp. ISL-88]MBT2713620.1 hypothetical protein [Pseudomonas sp. ISL-88]